MYTTDGQHKLCFSTRAEAGIRTHFKHQSSLLFFSILRKLSQALQSPQCRQGHAERHHPTLAGAVLWCGFLDRGCSDRHQTREAPRAGSHGERVLLLTAPASSAPRPAGLLENTPLMPPLLRGWKPFLSEPIIPVCWWGAAPAAPSHCMV